MQYIKNLLFGIVIGVANIVPGVSGGTMAVILNIYDKLINAIGNFKQDMLKNIVFLLNIGIGAGAGILLFSNAINYLINNYFLITNMFFVGLILGSIPLIYKKSRETDYKKYSIIPLLILMLLVIITGVVSLSDESSTALTTLNFNNFIKIFLASVISFACMIIPGISGSFVMLLVGLYSTIVLAISDFNIPILLPAILGAPVGIFGGAKIINILFKKFSHATYFGILGLIVGSIPVLFWQIYVADLFIFNWQFIIGFIVLLFGYFISYFSSNFKFKDKLLIKNKKN